MKQKQRNPTAPTEWLICPYCDSKQVYYGKKAKGFTCRKCGHFFRADWVHQRVIKTKINGGKKRCPKKN